MPRLLPIMLARTAAWALLAAGCLVLGALGRQHVPGWAAGLLPLALWLAATAALMARAAMQAPSARLVRRGLLGAGLAAGLATAWAGQDGAAPATLAAALGWAVLTVGATLTVHRVRTDLLRTDLLRTGGPRTDCAAIDGLLPDGVPTHGVPTDGVPTRGASTRGARAPAWRPAALGLTLGGGVGAGTLLGSTGDVAVPALLIVASFGLACLHPASSAPGADCRRGRFDGTLALGDSPGRAARRPGPGALALAVTLAARAAMWPMMAALPAMAAWCGGAGLPPAMTLGLHGAAMLLPAGLLRLAHCRGRACPAAPLSAGLLAAGGLALWARPDLEGLLAASLLQAMAWSVAWGSAGVPEARPAVRSAATAAAALSLLLLGLALEAYGPSALMATHAALAVLGAAAALAALGAHALGPVRAAPL